MMWPRYLLRRPYCSKSKSEWSCIFITKNLAFAYSKTDLEQAVANRLDLESVIKGLDPATGRVIFVTRAILPFADPQENAYCVH